MSSFNKVALAKLCKQHYAINHIRRCLLSRCLSSVFTKISARKTKQSIAFGLLLLAGIFTTSVSAQTVVNICDRTAVVESVILAAIPGTSDCTAVTAAQLVAITELDLSNMSITALQSGDFANLTGLTTLRLQGNTFTTPLPANLFDDLPSVAVIEIDLSPIGDLADIALTIGGTTTINIANAFISKDATGTDRDLSFGTTLSGTSATATVNEGVLTITASSTITGDTDVSITANDGTNNVIRTISVTVMDICSRTAQVQTAILARISETNDCTAVTATHLAAITSLNLSRMGITTLQSGDFVGLTSLTTLDLRENALTTLEAGTFSGLTSLITLDLGGNSLNTIEANAFSGLMSLARLDLRNNALITIEAGAFSGLTSLTELNLRSNALTTLETDTFSDLRSLGTLNLVANDLTTLEADTFSGLTSLTWLILDDNSLTAIEADTFSALRSLTWLYLGSNDLRALPAGVFDNLTSLTTLHLQSNDLTTLEADTFSNLTSLTTLHLQSNDLTTLEADTFSNLTSLTTLNLSSNDLTTLEADIFSDLIGLDTLNLASNTLTTIETGTFSALNNLNTLRLQNNDLTTIKADTFSNLTSLTFLDLTNNTLTTLPANAFSGLGSLTSLDLERNSLTTIEANAFSGLTSLTSLELGDHALTTIEADTFSGLTSLTSLGLSHNDLTTIEAGAFSGLNNLTTLRLDENNLATIEANAFSGLTSLTILWLRNNALTTIEANTFSGLTSLGTLRLSGNALITIEAGTFSNLSSLTFLDLNDNNLTTIEANAFSALTSLTILWLRNNALTTIEANTFSGLNNLTTLLLDDNTLTTLEANAFSGLTSLTFLDLGSHALTTIEANAFSGLTSLTILYLRNNDLTALPAGVFDNLTNLTTLYLTNNALITIEAGTFSALTSLTELRLSGNALTTLEANTFSGLMSLTELYLTHNDLTTIEADTFSALTSLTILHLNDNDLTALPAGVFDNLTSLTSLRLSANPITVPLPTDIFDPVSSASIWINLSPIGDLDEVALTVSGTTTINAANAFISRDLAGDDRTLSYTVTPANTSVATATEDSGVVTITGAGAGATTVSVTANDGRGSTVGMYTRDIAVTVAEADILAFDEATGDTIATPVAAENGGTDMFYVQLASRPAGNVTLSVVSSDTNEGTVMPGTLTFTATSWDSRQAVTVTAVDDNVDRDDSFMVDFAVTTGDSGNYPTTLNLSSVTVTVTDDDTAGIDAYDMATGGSEISAIITSEGGDAATFYVELTSQPTGTVTVTISGLVAGEHTLTTPTSTTLTFIPTGTTAWNIRQAVMLIGVDDNVVDGDQTYNITLTPTGGGYDSVMAETVSITNTDDDTATISIADLTIDENAGTATLTVTLTPAVTAGDVMADLTTTDGTATIAGADYTALTSQTLTFTAGSTSETLDIPINDDTIDEGDETFTVTLNNLMLPTGITTVSITDATAMVTITDDDTLSDTINLSVSPLTVAETAGTTTITVTATLDGTAVSPTDTTVTVSVGGGTATSGTDYMAVTDFTLTIPALSSSGMTTFMIDPTEDTTDDNNETVMISGTAPGFTTVNPATLTIVEVGISVFESQTSTTSTSTFTIAEASSDTFYVELASAPANDITLSIISDDTNEGMVSPGTLTFTVMNWNTRQALTITSVDDNIDRDDTFTVDFMITSGDGGDYPDTLTLPSVTVTVTNDDTADIAVFDGATGDVVPDVTTTEGGTTDTFYMVLTSQPTDTVSVTLTSGDTGEGLTRGNLLIFTTADWNMRQAVTVFGQGDIDVDGDQTYDVILTARGGGYDGVMATVPVTNEDGDTARFSIIESSVAENAGTATLTVTLGIPVTAGDVSVDVTTMDATAEAGEDYTALVSETLTFAAGEMLQTLSVTINDDSIAEGNELFTVMLDNPIAPTATGVTASSVGILIANSLVLIRDDDTAGIAVFDAATDGNPLTAITTAEAGTTTDTFHVALTSQPTGTVTVTVTSSDPSEGTITTGASLTFTAADWNSRQPIMVTGVDDNDVDGDIAYTVILRGTSTDTNYNGFLTAVNTTNTDDDTATLSIADMTVNEDAGTATLTVTLSAPVTTGDVMVNAMTADGTAEAGEDYTTITSQTLTFTAGSTSETLDITINDDNIAEGDETFTVMLGTLAAPAGVTIATATAIVTITDDETAPTGITLSVSQPTIADTADATEITVTATIDGTVVLPTDTVVTVSVGDVSDRATEGTDYVTVNDFDLTIPALSSSAMGTFTIDPNTSSTNGDTVMITGTAGGFTTINPATLTIVEAGISVFDAMTDGNQISTFTIAETSSDTLYVELVSQPVSDVILTLTSSASGEGTVTPPTLTFTTMNWNARQALTVTAVPDNIDRDGDSFMVDFIVMSGTGNYDPATLTTLPSVTVTVTDDDTAGIAVAIGDGVTTSETGTSDTFTVVLDSEPTDTVTITITGLRAGEHSLAPSTTLTFTTTDWNRTQTVTLTGVNDNDVDGNQTYDLTLTPTGGGYDSVTPATVSITNTDDDTATLSIADLSVDENAGTATLTVILTPAVTAGDVTVELTTADGTATSTDYTALTSQTLTFVAGSTSETLSITINDDTIDEANETFTVMLDNLASPTGVTTVSIADSTAIVTITDNDTAGIAVFDGPTGNAVADVTTSEGATTDTFYVALESQPTDTVTVTVTSGDPSEGTITTGASLTFTTTDWNNRQPVTVTGQNDDDVDGDQTYDVTLTPSGDGYDGVTPETVSITNTNDDRAELTISDLLISVDENAGTATVTVTLSAPVTAGDIEVELTTADGTAEAGEDYTALISETLTITAGSTSETLDITINDDNIAEVDETFTVTLSNVTVPAAVVSDVGPSDNATTITITDDEIAPTGITLSVSQPTIADTADATEITVTATLDGTVVLAAPTDISVSVGSATDSATEGTDYATVNDFDLTIPALSSSAMGTFTIDPNTSSTNGETITIDGTSGTFTFTATTLTIVEAGILVYDAMSAGNPISTATIAEASSDTFYVELASQPTGNVTLSVTSDDTNEGTVTPATLTFTDTTWNSRQPVTATAVPDNVDRDGDSFMVDFMVTSGTGNYDPATLTTLPSVVVTITDDDTPSTDITLTISRDNIQETAGETSITVTAALDGALSTMPTEVTVTVGGGTDMNEATVTTDYTLSIPTSTLTITIPALMASGNGVFAITPIADNENDNEETITISGAALINSNPVTVNTATLTITGFSREEQQVIEQTVAAQASSVTQVVSENIGSFLASRTSAPAAAPAPPAPDGGGGGDVNRENFTSIDWQDWQDRFAKLAYEGIQRLDSDADMSLDWALKAAGGDGRLLMPLGVESLTLWAAGGRLKTKGDGMGEYDGGVNSFVVGVDTNLINNWLLGIAASYSDSQVDYTMDGAPIGTTEQNLFSVHPFLSHSLPEHGLTLWVTGGYGVGDIDFSHTTNDEATSDVTQWMAAGGIEKHIITNTLWQGALRLKGLWGNATVDATEYDNGVEIRKVESTFWRARMESEMGYNFQLPGANVRPYALIGGRWDHNDAIVSGDEWHIDIGGGVEVLSGNAFALNISVHTQVTDGDTEEDSIIGTGSLTYDIGHDGQGLQITLSRPLNNTSPAWDQHNFNEVTDKVSGVNSTPLTSELAYGWTVRPFGLEGALQTYVQNSFGSHERHYAVGLELAINALTLNFETGYHDHTSLVDSEIDNTGLESMFKTKIRW